MKKPDPWAETAKQAAAGDQDAFATLYHHFWWTAVRLCNRYVANYDDAIEVAQSAFVQVYKHLPTFRFESGFGTWLHTICVRQALMFLRDHKDDAKVHSLDFSGLDRGESDVWDANRHRKTPKNLTQQFFDRLPLLRALEALEALSPRRREAFYMRVIEGWSEKEIADKLGITIPTVKSTIHAARSRVKAAMAGEFK